MDRYSGDDNRPSFLKILVRISVISVLVSMTISWLFISATSMLSFRQYADRNLQLLAYTVSHSLEAAVVFHDGNAAKNTLSELGKQGQFSFARVTDAEGNELAYWSPPDVNDQAKDPLGKIVSSWLFPKPVKQVILHNGLRVGNITLTGESSTVTGFVYRSLYVLTICLLIASAAALMITRHLHRGLVSALKSITGVVHDIRTTRNFSRRAPASKINELHVFGEDFNSLIGELEKWHLREKQERDSLLKRALRDPLTGLANRRAFDSTLDSVFKDTSRKKNTALLFMDGDNFKNVNDKLGHAAGDEVLVSIAARLGQIAGQSHLVCRFGGDEFAMVLEGISTDHGLLSIIEAVNQKMLEPIYLSDGENITVTLSIGWAVASKARNPQELMEMADRRMYDKKNGRI